MKIKLQRVHFMPKQLEPGVLYVSQEFKTAAHLCACGCGSKVSTPLGPAEWAFEDSVQGPTLRPSIGNWQLPCRSHYWILRGEVAWAAAWTPAQIADGRCREEARRRTYYDGLERSRIGVPGRFWQWLKSVWEKLTGTKSGQD